MSSSSEFCLEDFRIPLVEIRIATRDFSEKIGEGRSAVVYKGRLSERFKNRIVAVKRHNPEGHAAKDEFCNKLKLMLRFQHENIIPFIGYCDEDNEMIIVIKYAVNGSLENYLADSMDKRRRCLTWAERLKICIGVARGLQYLHSGLGEDIILIHRDIKGSNIYLDENLEAQIGDFELSVTVPKRQQKVYEPPAGTRFYLDPIYQQSGILKAEVDVYTFGVVVFELLTGMLAYYEMAIERDDEPQFLIKLVRRYYDVGLDKLIDPFIRDQMMYRSLHAFEEMAYKCISLNTKDRPTMDKIIKTLEEALNIQNRGTTSTTSLRTNQYREHGEFLIPLENIILATENFSSKNEIGDGTFTKVYKGEISERLAAFKRYSNKGEQEFFNELEMVSSFKHENTIPFIGYCYEGGEMIMIYEYAVNGSLDRHLQDPDRRRRMTWEERLKICLGVATALSYLHSGLADELGKVIHRNIKSENVLLNDNLEAKISGFGMSIVVPKDQRQVYEETDMLQTVNKGTQFYVDPIYQETNMLQTESDMYSFGLVVFEILSGMLAYHKRSIGDERPQNMTYMVHRYYGEANENLIDPLISDQIDHRSLREITKIAYKCISFNLKDRPPMNRVIKGIKKALDFQNQRDASTFTIRSLQSKNQEDFHIPLEEINKAKQKFGDQFIGSGGFGKVYKGKLSERWNNRTVAIKCLDLNGQQGKPEFDNELKLISMFHHENIIPFIGYCDEGNERILVFEYAINGSLDSHLVKPDKDRPITWAERLNICIGAARGLKYLHFGGEDKNKVIHRDFKSGNILLDEKFEAKICDFGLSTSGPDDQPYSKIFTKAAGTRYYIDPSYLESGILRTESDVYSFGVLMFELLTGIPAWHERNFGDGYQHLINLVRCYHDKGLDKLVDRLIKDKIDRDSLRTFTDIAYKCIDLDLKKRPTMERIIDRIEDALELQENYLAKAAVKVPKPKDT